MNVKKFLPQLITASITVVMLIVAFVLPKVSIPELSYPFLLFEKLGIYFDGAGYGIMNKSISINGTYEFIISLAKCISPTVVLSYALPILYSVLLVVALVILSKAASKTDYTWTVYLCAVLLPLVFADFLNLAFFKMLYIPPLILLTLLFICALFLTAYKNNKIGIGGIVAVTVIAIIYSCLGTVQALTAIVIGVLITRLSKISANKAAKILSVVLGCVVILQSIAFAFTFRAYDYKQTLYNSVFYGVCKYDSVTALGLDKELDDFKEVYYGMKEDAEKYDLENNFYNKISYKDIVKYYITHPVNAVKVISNQAKPSFYNDYKLGFTPYSSLKKNYIPTILPVVLGIAIVYIILAFVIAKKYTGLKPVCEFFAGVAVMWIISLVASSVYFGNCDIANNMITFNLLFDILLLGGFIGGVRVVIHGQEEKKASFGITHE